MLKMFILIVTFIQSVNCMEDLLARGDVPALLDAFINSSENESPETLREKAYKVAARINIDIAWLSDEQITILDNMLKKNLRNPEWYCEWQLRANPTLAKEFEKQLDWIEKLVQKGSITDPTWTRLIFSMSVSSPKRIPASFISMPSPKTVRKQRLEEIAKLRANVQQQIK